MKHYIFILLLFVVGTSLQANHFGDNLMMHDTIKEETSLQEFEKIELKEKAYIDLENNNEKHGTSNIEELLHVIASVDERLIDEDTPDVETILHPMKGDTIKEETIEERAERIEIEEQRYIDLAQSSEKRKADKMYEQLGFMASTEFYEDLVADGKASLEVMSHLANSYRLNNDTENAEYWYAKIIKDTNQDIHFLHYAQVLQTNEKCEDAIRWFEKYQEASGDYNRSFIKDCAEIDELQFERGANITNLKSINTEFLDFCPVKYKDGVVFTSTRGISKVTKHLDLWTKSNFSDLFYVEDNGKEVPDFSDPKPLEGDKINGKFHDGVATFNHSENLMIFTRNNTKGKSAEGLIDLQLYSAKKEGEIWMDAKRLDINDDEFASCHPTLSKDGKRLYFASNRPGGYGGMDIYMSRLAGGKWKEPENLGPTVNSSGNEIFPHIDDDEKLYFSSNGHKGLGGLDIFIAQKYTQSDESSWSIRENIGSPLNSPKDDFGFMVVEKDKSGYLTSSRDGGKGQDDIYRWEITDGSKLANKDKKVRERVLCVFDPETGERIPDAKVSILPTSESINTSNDELVLVLKKMENRKDEYVLSLKDRNVIDSDGDFFRTDERGTFTYPVVPGQEFMFLIEKTGYIKTTQKVSASEILSENTFCMPLKQRTGLYLEGTAKNKNFPKFIPNAEVTLISKCTGEKMTTITDADGEFDFPLDCDCEYELFAEKEFFKRGFATVSTVGKDCSVPGVVTTVIEMEMNDIQDELKKQDAIANGQYPNGTPPNGYPNPYGGPYPNGQSPYGPGFDPIQGPLTREALRRYFLGDPNNNFEVGQVITLQHIYYDFDKYYIRTDAAAELDYLVALMNFYPSLEIGMDSHTDCRGTNGYNEWLSRKRAKSSRQYLIDKGVSSHRIHYANGQGEYYLANYCEDGIDCSEDEHQLNRRTEITITQFNEPGVQIQSKR